MTYVEWLRIRNVLRGVAIVLGVLIVVSLVLRISFNRDITNNDAFIRHIQMQPGSTVSNSVLPNGTKRTTITDPADKTLVTIDDVGGGGRHVVIDEPHAGAQSHREIVTVGSVHVESSTKGNRSLTVIDTNASVPFYFFMAAADIVALIIATMLAAPFARENDGHLEIALTKPINRSAYGIAIMGVDLFGILAASAMTIVAVLICQAMFEIPHVDFSGVSANAIIMGIAFPFAWYAMIAASTASLKRGYGAVLGFAWPVAILIVVFGVISWGDSLFGHAVHNIFWTISRIDPLTYADMHFTENHATGAIVAPPDFGVRLTIELGLFLIYSALAILQWRRVEA